MKRHVWKNAFVIFMVMLLGAVHTLWAADRLAPGSPQARKDISQEQGGLGQYGQDVLSGLVGDIQIPKETIQSFSVLFERHKPELERLANAHQDLIWRTMDVVIEVLPSFRTKEAQEGKVRISRNTYAKASNLLEKCESLASLELARDLRKAKALFDSMVKGNDQESLIIDLKE